MSSDKMRERITRPIDPGGDDDWIGPFFLVSCSAALEERGQVESVKAAQALGGSDVLLVQQQLPDAVQVSQAGLAQTIDLRDIGQLCSLFPAGGRALIDMSGLSHPVWSSMLRAARATCAEVWAMYAEPAMYRAHKSPASRSVFDLSSRFGGVAPLPGMATLSGEAQYEDVFFVAFLGFEGARASHLSQQLEPTPKVIPVVGLPGFQIDYSAITIACNQDFLDETRSFADIRFARASCPFEAYDVLSALRADHPSSFLYVAPVGTKPHALGAVLFALEHEGVEIMYDHPERKAKRTSGVGRVHAYRVA